MIKKYDDRDVSWIKVRVDNTDGSQVAEFTPLEDSDDLTITTDDGDTVETDFEPWRVMTDLDVDDDNSDDGGSDDESDEAQLSRLYEQLESDIGNQIMPGAKDDFLVMLESGIDSVKSVEFNGERLAQKQ